MTETEHLLVCLAEECNEISQAISKALRFGLDDSYPQGGYTNTNRERIGLELNDLMGVWELLTRRGTLPHFDALHSMEKMNKVAKFMEYARERGTLEP